MSRIRTGGQSIFLLQAAVSVYFIILGLQTILEIQNPGFAREMARVFAGPDGGATLAMVLGILSLASGGLLLLELINLGGAGFSAVAGVAAWAVRIVLIRFMGQIEVSNGSVVFRPDLMSWLLAVANDMIILVAIHAVSRKYAKR